MSALINSGELIRLARDAAEKCEQPAFISVLAAEQVDALIEAAPGDGPLAGMPFVVKDNIDVEGVPTTAANPARTTPAPAHASAVARLIEAGAVPIGKTNLDQYATGLVGTRTPYGACHSVFSAEHVSGGSSSGSAIAVAADIVPFALATDTAGSGRVPAAFNELVGLKATKGRVSTAGLLPACRSLDCVTVLTKSVALARRVFTIIDAPDPADAYSRVRPLLPPRRPVGRPRIGVPSIDLDLDPLHQKAWEVAITKAEELFDVVPFDVQPFLDAASLLYFGPWLAERAAAFGADLLDGPDMDTTGVDPTVRQVVAGAATMTAPDAFRGIYELAELARQTAPTWAGADAILLPVTPTHPSLAEVASEPIATNVRLGRFTNMTNLLDLAAVAVPADRRTDGLPFGVQFLGPAFSDEFLLDVAAAWTGEAPYAEIGPDEVLIAVCGAHLRGQPLNADLLARGGVFVRTARTTPEYHLYEVPGPFRRPGLTALPGRAPASAEGVLMEIYSLPVDVAGRFIQIVLPPLAIGPIRLADGGTVLGFVSTAEGVDEAQDITGFGSWPAYLSQS